MSKGMLQTVAKRLGALGISYEPEPDISITNGEQDPPQDFLATYQSYGSMMAGLPLLDPLLRTGLEHGGCSEKERGKQNRHGRVTSHFPHWLATTVPQRLPRQKFGKQWTL